MCHWTRTIKHSQSYGCRSRIEGVKRWPDGHKYKTEHLGTPTAQSGNLTLMEGSRMSDFSIERILSPQLGHRPPAMHYLPEHQGMPAVYGLDSRCLHPPAPVPVGLLPYGVMSFADRFYPCSAGFHPAGFPGVYPNSGVCVHIGSPEPTGTLLSKICCLK